MHILPLTRGDRVAVGHRTAFGRTPSAQRHTVAHSIIRKTLHAAYPRALPASPRRTFFVLLALATFAGGTCAQWAGSGTWQRYYVPRPVGVTYTHIDFADSLHGWVLSDSGCYSMTSDAGRSWSQPATVPGTGLVGPFKIYDSLHAAAVMRADYWAATTRRLLTTTNAGETWTERILPEPANHRLISIVNTECIGFIGQAMRMYISTDHGESWSVDTLILGQYTYYWLQTFGILSRDLMFIGVGGEFYGGSFYMITDSGRTWTRRDAPRTINGVYGTYTSTHTANFEIYDGPDEFPFHHTDAYNSRCDPAFRGLGGKDMMGTLFDDGTYFFCDATQVIYKNSPDLADSTWGIIRTSYETDQVRSLACLTPAQSWILSTAGYVYRRIDRLTSVSERNRELPERFELLQNYPNPFNPRTTVRYELPSAGVVDLRVTDVLGREVYHIVENQPAGTQTTPITLSRSASGVYFCTVRFNGRAQTIRMALVW